MSKLKQSTGSGDDVPTQQARLETQKIDIERRKLAIEERRIVAEQRAKIWGPLSSAVPIFVVVLGFVLNAHTERVKQERDFITRQLNELYYPLYGRLMNDDAVWTIWGGESELRKANPSAANRVEQDVLLPNHRETLSLIDTKGGLLRNTPMRTIRVISSFRP